MKVTEIQIENLLAIESISFRPGTVTVVSGANGKGKTSILESIRAVFRGGHDPSLLRAGAARGTARMVLEDGTELVKVVTPEKSDLVVKRPDVGKISKSRAFVDSLVDELGVDPISLIQCRPADRSRYLLELVPMDVTDKVLSEAAGRPVGRDIKGTGLDRIESVYRLLYDERTGVNRAAKEKRATARQLAEGLPPESDPVPDPAALRAEMAALQAEREARVKEAREARAAAFASVRESAQATIDRIRKELELAVETLRRNAETQIDGVKKNAEADAEDIRKAEAARLAEIDGAAGPVIASLAEKIGQADEAVRARAQAERSREVANRMAAEADAHEKAASELSTALERVQELKAALLEKLPIAGLVARADDLYFEGLPFERLNTALQMEIAVKLAKLRAGKLGLIVVDHGEALDADRFEALKAAALSEGIQLVVGRVTDGPLSVEAG